MQIIKYPSHYKLVNNVLTNYSIILILEYDPIINCLVSRVTKSNDLLTGSLLFIPYTFQNTLIPLTPLERKIHNL